MKRKLALIGSTDLARQVSHFASEVGYEVVGFFDDFKAVDLDSRERVLGKCADAQALYSSRVFDEVAIGVGYKHMAFRARIFEDLRRSGIPLATLIHPSCVVDRSAIVGEGAILYPGCIVDQRVKIGPNVLVNLGCVIAHDTVVGLNSFLSPAVSIAGFCDIGAGCVLGIGTILIDGLSVADEVQTGGGTVVIESLKEKGVYVGNPARRIR